MCKSNMTVCTEFPHGVEEFRLNLPTLKEEDAGNENSVYFYLHYSSVENAWFMIMSPSEGDPEILVESARGKMESLIEYGFYFEDEFCGKWKFVVDTRGGRIKSVEVTRV